jgi:hypothetical protein
MLPTQTPEIVSAISSVSLIPVWLAEVAKWIAVIAGIVSKHKNSWELFSIPAIFYRFSLWKMQPNTPFTKLYTGSDLKCSGGA